MIRYLIKAPRNGAGPTSWGPLLFKFFLLLALVFNISCAKKKEEKDTVEVSYLKAVQLLNEKDFLQAAKAFEKIDDDYPFSKWAEQSQPMAAYCYYQVKEYADLVRVADDFIHAYPNHPDAAYMLYMKALAYYDQIPVITRAQDQSREASLAFRELIARFPGPVAGKNYSADAKEKLVFVNEHLAGALMSIGRYEMQNQNNVGAILRFNDVISRYSRTNQAPEAYFRLIEINLKIGMKTEAQAIYAKFSEQFPDSSWHQLAQKLIES